jgi:dTDP-4-dehydrorhamnose reductase
VERRPITPTYAPDLGAFVAKTVDGFRLSAKKIHFVTGLTTKYDLSVDIAKRLGLDSSLIIPVEMKTDPLRPPNFTLCPRGLI